MGFGDRLKELREQTQQAVAENRDRIQGAVQSAGGVANAKTKGRYADRIAKVGEKVSGGVDRFAAQREGTAQPGSSEPPASETDASAAPAAHEPANPVSPAAADEAAGGFPEFD